MFNPLDPFKVPQWHCHLVRIAKLHCQAKSNHLLLNKLERLLYNSILQRVIWLVAKLDCLFLLLFGTQHFPTPLMTIRWSLHFDCACSHHTHTLSTVLFVTFAHTNLVDRDLTENMVPKCKRKMTLRLQSQCVCVH